MNHIRILTEASDVKDVRGLLENLCEDWHGMEWCELSVLLSATRALAQLHQTHHWQASGDTFYEDHSLFQDLYIGTDEDVDKIAEKLVGFGSVDQVDAVAIASQCFRILNELFKSNSYDLVETSLKAEQIYLSIVEAVTASIEQQDNLSSGLENMLGDLVDKHEHNIYLLKQKLTKR